MLNLERNFEEIVMGVEEIRKVLGVVPTPGLKPEGSCFATRGGEMGNLLNAQLIKTTNGTGEWISLTKNKGNNDNPVVNDLYQFMKSEGYFD